MYKLYILKILNFLKARNKRVFITWQENSSLNGSYANIIAANENGVLLSFELIDTLSNMDTGKKALLRTSMLLRPIVCTVSSKDKNMLSISNINTIQIDREKRRFFENKLIRTIGSHDTHKQLVFSS